MKNSPENIHTLREDLIERLRTTDAIIVHGGGFKQGAPKDNEDILKQFKGSWNDYLSNESSLRVLALARILETDALKQQILIILCGGKTAGKTGVSEAKGMNEYLIELCSRNGFCDLNTLNKHKDSFVLEEKSLDTFSNADECMNIIGQERDVKQIAIITNSFHMQRALGILRERFQMSDISVEGFSAEELLEDSTDDVQILIKSLRTISRNRMRNLFSERLYRGINRTEKVLGLKPGFFSRLASKIRAEVKNYIYS